ncbi:MAG: hypothetical protein H6R14_769 [Proteobacteria bacterium]|nr:hypothetical protein [Pseudomonadota bacterium]
MEAAGCYYARLPTEAELTNLGLTPEDYEETAEVWPENWETSRIFLEMDTQWRIGMNGRTGLDYTVLFSLLDRHELTGDDWWQAFRDLQAMESAALEAMHSKS